MRKRARSHTFATRSFVTSLVEATPSVAFYISRVATSSNTSVDQDEDDDNDEDGDAKRVSLVEDLFNGWKIRDGRALSPIGNEISLPLAKYNCSFES